MQYIGTTYKVMQLVTYYNGKKLAIKRERYHRKA